MNLNLVGFTVAVRMVLNLVQKSDPEVDEMVSADWMPHVYISRRQFFSPYFHHSAENHKSNKYICNVLIHIGWTDGRSQKI